MSFKLQAYEVVLQPRAGTAILLLHLEDGDEPKTVAPIAIAALPGVLATLQSAQQVFVQLDDENRVGVIRTSSMKVGR